MRVSKGWEDSGIPWCFGRAGTACEGEQGAGKAWGISKTLGYQVVLLGMSRGLGGQGVPLETRGAGTACEGE